GFGVVLTESFDIIDLGSQRPEMGNEFLKKELRKVKLLVVVSLLKTLGGGNESKKAPWTIKLGQVHENIDLELSREDSESKLGGGFGLENEISQRSNESLSFVHFVM